MIQRFILGVVAVCITTGVAGTVRAAGEGDDSHRDRAQYKQQDPRVLERRLERFKEEMFNSIELEGGQREEIDAVFEDFASELGEQMKASRGAHQERAAAIRELVDGLREAQQSGDRGRVQEIRSEMAKLRKTQSQVPALNHDGLFAEVREILDEEQTKTFDRLADRFKSQSSRPARRAEGIQQLRRALGQLELSDEQQARTRDLFSQTLRETRQGNQSPDELEEMETSLQESILEELDEEQATEFEAALERLKAKDDARDRRRGTSTRRLPSHDAGEPAQAVEHDAALEEADIEHADTEEGGVEAAESLDE